ncbi:MAG: hypothetical protein ACHQT6_08680 [Candidatus Acidiferrales bacterium]
MAHQNEHRSDAAGGLLLLSIAPRAAAQCSMGSNYSGIALRAGSPFQAEKTTAFTQETPSKLNSPVRPPELVARDGQGRIRTEMTGGKFKVEEGEGAGTESVQQMVSICDPVSGKLVGLDTISKTATIMARGPLSQRSAAQPQSAIQMQRPYCRTFASTLTVGNLQREDLGHQTIEGFDAQGVRSTNPTHLLRNGEEMATTTINETWCSEELGAMLLQVHGAVISGQAKTEMKLTKIVPGEPDPSLFQIPPDYRIVERVPEERKPGQFGTSGISSTIQVPVPVEAPPQ